VPGRIIAWFQKFRPCLVWVERVSGALLMALAARHLAPGADAGVSAHLVVARRPFSRGGSIVLDQFKKFMLETNAFSLAIGVVIGGAVAKLVSALVADLLMPIISLILPGGAWREFSISLGEGHDPLKIGDIMGATIDFLIIAVVVYVVIVKLFKIQPVK
jgi:large conductance mechanosensitive channel protein